MTTTTTAGEWPYTESFGFTGASDELTLNLAIVPGEGPPRIRSWVNGASTPQHGTHVEGVMAALDGHRVQAVMVHVVMLHPAYAGPVRHQLGTSWVKEHVENMLKAPITDWFDR
ncbi:MAG: hypothetical protein KC910_25220 [Candidatus Eremiobacteraeota bacterium]|nr:hypothetical protein [Candidatus Eremiobacteraeota bacterium]